VDNFTSQITERGRSKFFEEIDNNLKTTTVDEALIILASVEKSDEHNPEVVAQKATEEIAKLAGQLKVKTIVIHPFAHLFGELSSPIIAVKALKLLENNLSQNGFRIIRTPFGWFNTLELKAKGHPLSRVARVISAQN